MCTCAPTHARTRHARARRARATRRCAPLLAPRRRRGLRCDRRPPAHAPRGRASAGSNDMRVTARPRIIIISRLVSERSIMKRGEAELGRTVLATRGAARGRGDDAAPRQARKPPQSRVTRARVAALAGLRRLVLGSPSPGDARAGRAGPPAHKAPRPARRARSLPATRRRKRGPPSVAVPSPPSSSAAAAAAAAAAATGGWRFSRWAGVPR
eukprot:scaffold1457_cov350-Prasinococcus_capsulatus_cf.AAC.7